MANFNIDYLVVAGGGGGGPGYQAGGGGAGGLRTSYGTSSGGGSSNESQLTLASSTSYVVTVGDGGAGGAAIIADSTEKGDNGDNSVFHTITSLGGGGGASYYNVPSSGLAGGSGGGAGNRYQQPNQSGGAGAANQGYAGGNTTTYIAPYSGGGGGGAASAGADGGASGALGYGGNGLEVNIVGGTGNYYAGGGGAGVYSNGSIPTGGSGGGGDGARGGYSNVTTPGVGLNELGGGGGGAGVNNQAGADGGSGIVILRYTTADVAGYTATGLTPTETTDGTDTILSFTTVGTGTITFTTPIPPFSGTKVTTPVTDFNKPNTEEGLKIPSGTSSNQPTGVEGMVRNDTTQSSKGSSSAITYYNGTNWRYFENELNTSFNTVLYTGTSSTNAITSVGFQPDLIWIKSRSGAFNNMLTDSINGGGNFLIANTTAALNSNSSAPTIDASGFTLGAGNSNWNNSSYTYVAWCFKAGGTAVSNTNGDITSQVSANNDLGFSIVKYTGNLTAATTATGQSVGHGMDVPPELIIFKSTSNSTDWNVFSSELDNWSTRLELNDSVTKNNLYSQYPIADPTSSVFYTNYLSAVNVNNYNYIAYCFASKPNYSKVGTYLGNGNATGPIVTLGFEPAFVMIKGADQSGDWTILDNKRDTSNPNSARLDANSNMAEYSAVGLMDFNSDGFQIVTSNAGQNANGKTFIYLAFANTI